MPDHVGELWISETTWQCGSSVFFLLHVSYTRQWRSQKLGNPNSTDKKAPNQPTNQQNKPKKSLLFLAKGPRKGSLVFHL